MYGKSIWVLYFNLDGWSLYQLSIWGFSRTLITLNHDAYFVILAPKFSKPAAIHWSYPEPGRTSPVVFCEYIDLAGQPNKQAS